MNDFGPSRAHHCELDVWNEFAPDTEGTSGQQLNFDLGLVTYYAQQEGANVQASLGDTDSIAPVNLRLRVAALDCARKICSGRCPLFEFISVEPDGKKTIAPRQSDEPTKPDLKIVH